MAIGAGRRRAAATGCASLIGNSRARIYPSQRYEPGAWGPARMVASSLPARVIQRRTAVSSLFTSESVTEGHPDKLADQISDAILDAILAKDPLARVACEAIVTTGLALVVGEITTDCYVDIPR